MPRNGSGTFSLPSGNPVVTGTTISSSTTNTTFSDIATALTASIAKDGQTTPTANLPMGGYKHTGAAAGSARTDYATISNIQDGTGIYVATVGGTSDVITLTPSPAIASYTAGQFFSFISSGANTTNVTVNISGLGAKAITKNGATALTAGDIPSGALVSVIYDGTQFQLQTSANLNPLSSITGLGTGVATALAVNVGSAGAPVVLNGALGTPSSGTLTNCTGLPAAGLSLTTFTNSLGADVNLNNIATYFDGPSVSQGTTGIFLAIGHVTLTDNAGGAGFETRLTDGTTAKASSYVNTDTATRAVSITLMGLFTNPAGNIRMQVRDITSTSGVIRCNSSTNSLDSSITVVRIG